MNPEEILSFYVLISGICGAGSLGSTPGWGWAGCWATLGPFAELARTTYIVNKVITINKNSKCLLKINIPSIVMLAGSDK